MARTGRPWFWKARDAWYVTIQGRRHQLARGFPAKAEATRAFHKLMAAGPAPVKVSGDGLRVGEVCNLYVLHARASLAPLTAEFYERYLGRFARHAGKVPASEAAPKLVTAWLAKRPSWGASTRSQAITAVKRAFRWARREGHIAADPFSDLDKPAMRARRTILTREQAARIRAAIAPGDPFGDFVDVLADTGCRPSEAMRIEARHLETSRPVAVMDSKTSARTGKKRTIYLTPRVATRLAELAAIYPAGPLLRSRSKAGRGGSPWTRHTVMNRFRRLRVKLGLGPEATAESYRHLFITDALERGIPIATVAELVGHSSTIMISKYYSKLSQRHAHLEDALAKIRGHEPSPHVSGPQIASGPDDDRDRREGGDPG